MTTKQQHFLKALRANNAAAKIFLHGGYNLDTPSAEDVEHLQELVKEVYKYGARDGSINGFLYDDDILNYFKKERGAIIWDFLENASGYGEPAFLYLARVFDDFKGDDNKHLNNLFSALLLGDKDFKDDLEVLKINLTLFYIEQVLIYFVEDVQEKGL